MRQKGPHSLPFIRRAPIILRLGDMASRGGTERGKNNHRKAGNIKP
jgi:hypothetical protein